MKAALLALALLLPGVARAAGDLRTCLPLPGGRTAVGGDGGLVLLDAAGTRLGHALTARTGLPDTRVLSLALVGRTLFVGTEAGVAALPLGGPPGQPLRAVRSAAVRAILSHGGELLLGTFDGVRRLTASGVLAEVPFLEAAPAELEAARRRVTALARFQGTIVVGTGAGLYRLEGKPGAEGLRRLEAALPSEQVFALHARADGALLVGTLLGLAALGARPPLLPTPSPDLRAIAGDRERLYLGSFGEGLFAGPAGGRRLVVSEPSQARHLTALSLAEDGAGCLAAREGLWLRASGARPAWRRVELGGLPSHDLSALAAGGGTLWLGTFDRGLFRLEARTGALTAFPGIEPQVNALAVEAGAGTRTVWVGTSRGLYALHGTAVRRLGRGAGLPSEDIHALALTRRGLLVGTGRGAALLRDGKVVEVVGRKRGLVISAVWAVAETDDGSLWLGTSKGVFRGRFRGAWRRLSVASGHLTDDWVTALAARGGSVWVGSYSGGVTRLDPSGPTLTATVLDRESWVNFAGLSLVDGNLLVATMDGLRRCPLASGACQALGAALPGRDVTAAAKDGETLWVATRRGLGRLTGAALR